MYTYVGTTGQTVTVTCNTGYSGGGTATCRTNGAFNTLTCAARECTAARVTNSNYHNPSSIQGKLKIKLVVQFMVISDKKFKNLPIFYFFCSLVFTGTTGQKIEVTCDSGFSHCSTCGINSKYATCGTNGNFNTLTCTGNTCTCSNGTPTYAARGISGERLCTVQNAEDCEKCNSGYTLSCEGTQNCPNSGNQETCVANTCTCPGGTPTVATGSDGTLCEIDDTTDCSACDAGYTIDKTPAKGTASSCVGKVCTCPNGTPAVASGSGGTLCDTATVDCSACNAGYTISASPASGSAQTCVANTCTCPNGTPTVASGSGGTLCDTATVDCSGCNAGYSISASPASGSAQTCNIKSCTATYVLNSNKATANSITGKK